MTTSTFVVLWVAGAGLLAVARRPHAARRPLVARAPGARWRERARRWRGWDGRSRVQLPFAARRARRRTVRQSQVELADVIDLFTLAVGSGLNVRLGLAAVATRAPPMWREPLARAVQRIELGSAVADALETLPQIVGDHAHPLVTVLVSSERYGTALLPALERLAADARLDRRRRAEEQARRVPVKLLFPLVCCILPAFGALTVAPLLAGAFESLRL